MIVEVGRPVVLVEIAQTIWHVPLARKAPNGITLAVALELATANWPTLCGLTGDLFVYDGPVRARRRCSVCHERLLAGETSPLEIDDEDSLVDALAKGAQLAHR